MQLIRVRLLDRCTLLFHRPHRRRW